MKNIAEETLAAMQQRDPIAAGVWQWWIYTGKALIVEDNEREVVKC